MMDRKPVQEEFYSKNKFEKLEHLVSFIIRIRIAILKTIDPKLSIHCGVHAYHERCVHSVAKTRECSIAVRLSVLNFDVKIVITGGIGLELLVMNLESAAC
jgi:hypothetical protein